MTTITDNGGPAFPVLAEQSQSGYPESGMTLRDYFAAKALTGVIANWEAALTRDKEYLQLNDSEGAGSGIAQDAYQIADAMIKARSA